MKKNGQAKVKHAGIHGIGRLRDMKKRDGKIQIKLPYVYPFWRDYDILSTDFTSYAIIYHCTTRYYGLFHLKSESFHVITRRPLDEETDFEEYNRIKNIASNFLEKHLEDFDFNQTAKAIK